MFSLIVRAVTHFPGALVFPVGDFILQLLSKHIPDGQLAAIFKHRCELVAHIQGDCLLVLAHSYVEVWFADVSCGEEWTGSDCVTGSHSQNNITINATHLKNLLIETYISRFI